MGNNILTRENESSSIEKLAAQRQIYYLAKKLFYLQVFITVISLVLLSFLQLVFSNVDFTHIIAIVSFIAVIADNLLEKDIKGLKEKAAKIQELFDTYVLNIKWNITLCQEKPEYNEIYKYYLLYKNKYDISMFTNWYEPEIATISETSGKVICQKTNCIYDSNIRKKYNCIFLIIGIITIVLIIIFTIVSNITLSKVVLTIIFPAIPIIQWTNRNITTNSDSIKNLEQLNKLINLTCDTLKTDKLFNISNEAIRQIQDGIYINRKGSPLIPDFIYNKLRDKLENQTYNSVKQLVNEISVTK